MHTPPVMPMSIPNHGETSVLPWHLYSGLKDCRDSKDFESWYAPYKLSLARNTPNHSLPPSLLHAAPLMDGQRKSPLHRGKDTILLPGGPTPLGTDPLTGLPHHHSHSHIHTHYHLHPGEQHLNPPGSPSLGLEPNWLWRNPHVTPGHDMWLHPHGLGGPPRHLINPGEDLNGVPPYFPGLYPPPVREYQLQQELMLSQGVKIDHSYPFYPPLISTQREHLMPFARPHDRQPRLETELRRLETGDDSSSASLIHRTEARSLRSPSLKNFEPASYMTSNQQPVTIDLSKDD